MWGRIDSSQRVANLINFLSEALARQRGLVPLISIFVVAGGVFMLLLNVFVGSILLEFFGILFQGVGFIAALIGLLLAEPLGK